MISAILLNNISQTVHNLMTGAYDRRFFCCPYNDLVADELTDEKGAAYETFTSQYQAVDYLEKKLSALGRKRGFREIENLEDCIMHLQELLLNESFKQGYIGAVEIGSPVRKPVFESLFKDSLQTPGGTGFAYYTGILECMDVLADRFRSLGGTGTEFTDKMHSILSIMENRFSILCDIACSYGIDLASGTLPVWSNPELSYTNYCRSVQLPSLPPREIMELYSRETENWTLKPSFFQCFQTGLMDLQESMDSILSRFPPELKQEAENLLFIHSFIETADLQNVFAQGFRQGMRVTLESLYDPCTAMGRPWTE